MTPSIDTDTDTDNELRNLIEAVLLVADAPLSAARIQGLFEANAQPTAEEITAAIAQLQTDCAGRGVELRKIGGGYRYQTRDRYAQWIRKLHATRPPRLSRAVLETLAIIAYRQPVTRGDIEQIRGVAVTTEIMRRLTDREWVKEVGVRDLPGHPALYATTSGFLSYFGLESLRDLPPLAAEREISDLVGEMDAPSPSEVLAALHDAAAPAEPDAAANPPPPADTEPPPDS